MKLQHILAEGNTYLSAFGPNGIRTDCTYMQLTSLEGSPTSVKFFNCSHNRLTSLEGAPTEVTDNFLCAHNKLTSLKGCPTSVSNIFDCSYNNLTSLKWGPTSASGWFDCSVNELTSLEGAPIKAHSFYCANNKLTSLKDIHKHIKEINDAADFSDNPIKSHVLGLLKIKFLTNVKLDNEMVDYIINKHLAGDRNILACQSELLDAGLDAFAQL